ncbi:M56 family metallopeptidase [Draconibacterium sp. IB214405]|uniref:M56 family metallopeptidase n=1 Tax=Draconibacterium sp. IB214405 TaxID=3097352 RepID=UPI002A12FBF1|nr:M56 family metallopeptidase [Draconibacterium sp. IB214405]MDX8339566.1 M56 family metallopeptidase [Draconibacterium sp. IB214405]
MNNLVNFIIESGVSLSLLALIYVLFLRKETFFRLNRLFLLFSILFSVILPFLHFRVYAPQSNMLAEVTVTPYRNLLEAVTIYGQDLSGAMVKSISSSKIIISIYLLGLTFFLGRMIFRIIQVMLIIVKNEVQYIDNYRFVMVDKDFSPFSFLGYIFINPNLKSKPGYERMVTHEMEHIKQGHSFDVLILETLTVFQWFNPFMWLLKRAIRENHEYLADSAVLNSGISTSQYKQLLLSQAVGFQLDIANNFNSSLIKKRIQMISKIRSSKFANLKYILGFLSLLALVIIFACEQKKTAQITKVGDSNERKITISLLDDRLKVDGEQEDLEVLYSLVNEKNKYEFDTDSTGTMFLVKSKVEEPRQLDEEDQVFFIVEEMPEFPGGDIALRKYIAASIKYPDLAIQNGIQGKVYVSFVVTTEGAIANAKIARGVDPSIDREALRVVNSLPKWKPGYQRGVPVNVSYTVPINFVLQ